MGKLITATRGLFQDVFGKKNAVQPSKLDGFFKTFTSYSPAFTSWGGELYESELVRASVDTIARHISKLTVNVTGTAKPHLRSVIRSGPNNFQSWSQFMYRCATILLVQNNCIIVPVLGEDPKEIAGYFPVLPDQVELMDVDGEPWIKFRFNAGQIGYMEFKRCGILTKYQYRDDIFGTANRALNPTMQIMNMVNQGIEEGIKNSATFRWVAQSDNFADSEDLKKEMERFNRQNLRGESGGLLLFPVDYKDIKQVDQKPYMIDSNQMQLIRDNVFNYFGVSDKALRNELIGDAWAAFYDGCLEPIVIQLTDVMTRMTFSRREIAAGNAITVSGNRLQYASTKEKLDVSSAMADRGVMNRDEIREIWGLAPLPNGEGQKFLVRGEYKDPAEDKTPVEETEVIVDEREPEAGSL